VTQFLVVTITVVAGVVVLLGAGTTLAGRRFGLLHLAGTCVLVALLLVQAGLAVAGLIGGHHLAETATFFGYLIGIVLVPILGALWAWTEPTRWAGTQVAVAALAVAVMVWRLLEIWQVRGA
jgi:hypothetical protein